MHQWQSQLTRILEKIKAGKNDVAQGVEQIMDMMSHSLGFAEVDSVRALRTGFPEVVFCQNKADQEIVAIVKSLAVHNSPVLLTRCRESTYALLRSEYPDISYHPKSGAMVIGKIIQGQGLVTVVSAGTSDIPVAEEAAVTARALGAGVETFWDIGVAGIHRLFSKLETLGKSRAIVAVAGMDGALPGVIAGLVRCPVIAVPTAIGYGANFQGLAPLLTMLNACAPGVAVVNIDNGFGAGYLAALINRTGA